MSAANRPPNSNRDFEEALDRIAALERVLAAGIPISDAASASINSIYISSVDGKLYFKNAAGASNALY